MSTLFGTIAAFVVITLGGLLIYLLLKTIRAALASDKGEE